MKDLVAPRLRPLARLIGGLFRRSSQAQILLPDSKAELERREAEISVDATLDATTPTARHALPSEGLQAEEVAYALETFAGYSRSFTLREFGDWLDPDVDVEAMKQKLLNDPRIVYLGPVVYDEYFIPESGLFRWWHYFSLRLARARRARLTSHQLALAMSSLRHEGR